MLTLSNISKQFRGADAPLLKNITFTVNAGERVAIIGPNGCGKSTLLRIIMGELEATTGKVQFNPPDLRIGCLHQGLEMLDTTRIEDVLFPNAAALRQLEVDFAHLADMLARGEEVVTAEYEATLERLTELDSQIDQALGERLLTEVGLEMVDFDTPVGTLSGGQKTRLMLAAVLVNQPQLLILDEPTNHLDLNALRWLEDWINGFAGGVLMVSHDRAFLDRVANHIVAIDPEKQTARVFVGAYSDYLDTLQQELEHHWSVWKDQELETARLRTIVQRTGQWAERANAQAPSQKIKLAATMKAKEKQLERYLSSDERIDKPKQGWNVKIDFDVLPKTYGNVAVLENLEVGYRADQALLRNLHLTVRGGERVVIMGPNGQGKSTLLKTMMGELASLAGSVRFGPSVKVGYLAQEQEILDPSWNALQSIQAVAAFNHTEARSFLHFFLFAGEDVFRPIGQLSFGERTRLMLALLVARGSNLLLMDEPLNHLDLPSRERFEHALDGFPGSFVMVTHDRYFAEKYATTIWHIENGTLAIGNLSRGEG